MDLEQPTERCFFTEVALIKYFLMSKLWKISD